MKSMQDGRRPARRFRAAFLVPLFALGGCTVFFEEGEVNLAEVMGDDGPCGIFYACDDYRDRDQGRHEKKGEKSQKKQSPGTGQGSPAISSAPAVF